MRWLATPVGPSASSLRCGLGYGGPARVSHQNHEAGRDHPVQTALHPIPLRPGPQGVPGAWLRCLTPGQLCRVVAGGTALPVGHLLSAAHVPSEGSPRPEPWGAELLPGLTPDLGPQALAGLPASGACGTHRTAERAASSGAHREPPRRERNGTSGLLDELTGKGWGDPFQRNNCLEGTCRSDPTALPAGTTLGRSHHAGGLGDTAVGGLALCFEPSARFTANIWRRFLTRGAVNPNAPNSSYRCAGRALSSRFCEKIYNVESTTLD